MNTQRNLSQKTVHLTASDSRNVVTCSIF